MFKRSASAELDKSSKPEILNIRELMREGPNIYELMREGQAENSTSRQTESSDGETSANLRSLLGRVAETSGREVDNLKWIILLTSCRGFAKNCGTTLIGFNVPLRNTRN